MNGTRLGPAKSASQPFASFRSRNYDEGMIMAAQDDWVNVSDAAGIAGCSEQFLRRDLIEHLDEATGRSHGRVEGWRVNTRAWLVLRQSAVALRETLSTRARLHEADRKAKAAAGRRRAARPKPSRSRKTR